MMSCRSNLCYNHSITRFVITLCLFVITSAFYVASAFQGHPVVFRHTTPLTFRHPSPPISLVFPHKIKTSIHSNIDDNNDEFWKQQRSLINELSDRTTKTLKQEQLKGFGEVQGKLIGETSFISLLMFSVLWLACDNPFVPISYLFGAIFGLAYTYGLGKYVETLGGTADDASVIQGAGVGQARFAFLILLFIFVGKLRVYGLIEIPSILGFFTYQLASLSQGLRDENY